MRSKLLKYCAIYGAALIVLSIIPAVILNNYFIILGAALGIIISIYNLNMIYRQVDSILNTFRETMIARGKMIYFLTRMAAVCAGGAIVVRLDTSYQALITYMIGLLQIKLTIYTFQIKNKEVF